jgi:hypothetical protein
MSSSNGSFTTTSRKTQQTQGRNQQGNGRNQGQGFRGNAGTQSDSVPFRKFTIPLMKAHVFGKHYNRQDLLNRFRGVNSIYVNYNRKFAMKGKDRGMTGVTLTIRGEVSDIEACFAEGKRRIQQSFESDARRKQDENAQRIEGIVSNMEESAKNAKQNVETMNVTPKNTGKKNGFDALGDEDSMKNYQESQNAAHQKRLDKEVKRNLAEQMKIPPSTEWSNVVKTKTKKIVRSTSLTNISTTQAVTAGDNWGDFADE